MHLIEKLCFYTECMVALCLYKGPLLVCWKIAGVLVVLDNTLLTWQVSSVANLEGRVFELV